MLFGQQLLIRGIAVKYDSILQLFCQLGGALLIALNQLHAVVLFQPPRQPGADITAADQHDAFVGLFKTLQLAHYRADILRGGDKEDFISGLNDG